MRLRLLLLGLAINFGVEEAEKYWLLAPRCGACHRGCGQGRQPRSTSAAFASSKPERKARGGAGDESSNSSNT